MKQVVILGAGRLGSVISQVLKNNNIDLWDNKLGLVESQKEIEDIIPFADFIFLCIPSWTIRNSLKK